MNKRITLSNVQEGIIRRDALPINVRDEVNKNYHLLAPNSNLILSSAVGSVIAVSGSLDLPQTDKAYHIRAVNSHLILSSSAGSVVFISGTVKSTSGYSGSLSGSVDVSSGRLSNVTVSGTFTGSISGSVDLYGGRAHTVNIFNTIATGTFSGSISGSVDLYGGQLRSINIFNTVASGTFSGSLSGSLDGYGGKIHTTNIFNTVASGTFSGSISGSVNVYGGIISNVNASGTFSGSLSGSLNTYGGSINNSVSNLILSSTGGSIIALSASQDFTYTNKNYHIRAVNSDLILSSSSPSRIYISGAVIIASLTASTGIFNQPGGIESTLKISRPTGFWGFTIEGQGTNQADMIMYVSGGTQDQKTIQQLVNNSAQYLIRGLTDALAVSKTFFLADLNTGMTAVGATSVTTSAKLAIGGTDGAFLPPRLTDAQKDALTPTAGMIIYNSTSGSLSIYTTAWKLISMT